MKTPGDGSDIIFLKLSSVFSLIALRNVGTKNAEGCMLYMSLCKGCKTEDALVGKSLNKKAGNGEKLQQKLEPFHKA